jgi:NAD(P)-dependent dehydrogenase (short-subunit alcohol dehydrogenase family)
MRLRGKVALVTGAAGERSIGRGIARALADEGANVAVNDISRLDKLQDRAAELREVGVESLAIPADVSDRQAVDEMIALTVSRFGKLDIIVSNAGVVTWEPYLEITPESVDRMLGVNIRGTFNVCQSAARQMIDQGHGGRIVIISSVHAQMPFPSMAVYGATKHALHTFTNCLAIELAPYGITANHIGPGWVRSAINDPSPALATDEDLLATLKMIPLGRPAKPHELGRAVVYYASKDGDYVTGTYLRVDGGLITSKY